MTVTLITGGNKGLGYETARKLIEQGHTVHIGARSVKRGKERHDLEATGKQEASEYQRGVLERFSQIRMIAPLYTASSDGHTVFVEARGDYIAGQGNQPYNNVYIFKFVVQDSRLSRVYEYANPVTYAKLAGLPLG